MIERIDWDRYAELYDLLLDLSNYQKLQHRVVELAQLETGMLVLDVGCGTGNTTLRMLEEDGVSVIGLDRSPPMLSRAHDKLGQFVEGDLVQAEQGIVPFPNASFNRVVSVNALYAVDDPDRTVQEWHRVLKPEGRLVVANPFDPRLALIFGEYLMTVVMKEDSRSLSQFEGKLPEWKRLIEMNRQIEKLAQDKKYHFLPADKLSNVLDKNGFAVEHWEEAYGPTVVIMAATKKREIDKLR